MFGKKKKPSRIKCELTLIANTWEWTKDLTVNVDDVSLDECNTQAGDIITLDMRTVAMPLKFRAKVISRDGHHLHIEPIA